MDSGSYDSDTVPSSSEEEDVLELYQQDMEDRFDENDRVDAANRAMHRLLNPNPPPWSGVLADSYAWQMETLESLRGARESSPPVPPD